MPVELRSLSTEVLVTRAFTSCTPAPISFASKQMLSFAATDAGGSPAASHFSCFAKKSNQKKAAPGSPPFQGALRYSRLKAAAELVGRNDFSSGALAMAPSSDSPRRQPLQPLRCSAARTGFADVTPLCRFKQADPLTSKAAMVVMTEGPVRLAEQRKSRGGSPRAMFEGEHFYPRCLQACLRARVLRAARGSEQRREPRRGEEPGSPFLWFLSFGEAKERNLPPGNPRLGGGFLATAVFGSRSLNRGHAVRCLPYAQSALSCLAVIVKQRVMYVTTSLNLFAHQIAAEI